MKLTSYNNIEEANINNILPALDWENAEMDDLGIDIPLRRGVSADTDEFIRWCSWIIGSDEGYENPNTDKIDLHLSVCYELNSIYLSADGLEGVPEDDSPETWEWNCSLVRDLVENEIYRWFDRSNEKYDISYVKECMEYEALQAVNEIWELHHNPNRNLEYTSLATSADYSGTITLNATELQEIMLRGMLLVDRTLFQMMRQQNKVNVA